MKTDNEIIELNKKVNQTRKNILELLETALKDNPDWPLIRGRVMGYFGRDGLGGSVKKMILLSVHKERENEK